MRLGNLRQILSGHDGLKAIQSSVTRPAWMLSLIAVTFLAHLLTGFAPFPIGDDFAYAPLADLARDDSLFPRDVQLRMFENHAQVYSWVYGFASALGNVGVGFLVVTVLLSFFAIGGIRALLATASDQATTRAYPLILLVLGLSVFIMTPGIGRGLYGGYISPIFHHQYVALIGVALAIAACLGRHPLMAGLFIGMAAWAQPASAAHGALAVGLGFLISGRDGYKALLICAATSMIVAAPVVITTLQSLIGGSEPITVSGPIDNIYRFRAPHHHNMKMWDLALSGSYILTGLGASWALAQQGRTSGRIGYGLMAGWAVLWLVCALFYAGRLSDWSPLFILDATRSSPIWFVSAAALLVAALAHEREAFKSDKSINTIRLAILLAGFVWLFLISSSLIGKMMIIISLLLYFNSVFKDLIDFALGLIAIAAGGLAMANWPLEAELEPGESEVFAWVKSETPPDSLFIVPIDWIKFRHYSQRSTYVDFKTFSVGQPDQAALTVSRLIDVARPDEANWEYEGWPAAERWALKQHENLSCESLTDLFERTQADYLVLKTPLITGLESNETGCPNGGPINVYNSDTFTVISAVQ